MPEPTDPNNEQLTPDEELRAANEIKRSMLELDFGATSFVGHDAPPELIAQFLDNVRTFHENIGEPKTVREILGDAQWPPSDSITTTEEAEEAIANFMQLLAEHNILTDVPEHLSAQAYYRFLSTELIDIEIIPPIEGMHYTIPYDEVRFDGPYHIAYNSEQFLLSLFDLEAPFEIEHLSGKVRLGPEVVAAEVALEAINDWRAQFQEIHPLAFEAGSPKWVANNGMFFQFLTVYQVIYPDGSDQEFNGPGIIQLAFEEGHWKIQGASFPGFQL